MARKAKAAKSGKQVVGLSRDDLLRIGVPSDWVPDVQAASEDRFFELASHLPAEAQEALLEFATTGALPSQEIPDFAASELRVVRHSVLAERAFEFAEAPRSYEARENLGYSHPDAQRRFRTIENVDDLKRALDYPWDKWAVFLHPSQRDIVERNFSGPARVAGSAGTGKTVVALHRTARLAQSGPQAHILLTTFSRPLEGHPEDRNQVLALEELAFFSREMKILGVYPAHPFRSTFEETPDA